MARTYEDIKNRIKNKEEKESKNIVSSSESRADRITKKRQEKSIGLDTLESDLHTMGETLSNIYGSWQTKETMDNTFESVNKVYKRLGEYQDYYNQGGKESGLPDLSELLNTYKNAVDKWGERTELYGNYQNADAYNKAVKNFQLSEKFKGLSYGDVQARMRRYSPDSDEYNYLKNYTGYTSTEDFDKAIAGLYDGSKLLSEAKEYEGKISSYEGRAKTFEGRTRGLINDGGFGKKADDTKAEYDAWLNGKGYSSADEFKSEMKATNDQRKALEEQKKLWMPFEEFKGIEQNADFGQKSGYVKKDVKYESAGYGSSYLIASDEDAHKYNLINGDKDAQDYESLYNVHQYGTNDDIMYEYLEPEEKQKYNYLWETQGPKKANQYADALAPFLRQRRVEHEAELDAQMARENPFATSVVSVFDNVGNNMMALPMLAADALDGDGIDENSSLYRGRRRVNTERSTVEGMIDSDIGKFFYRHGLNTADNLATMAVSGFGKYGAVSKVIQTGIMSSGAFVDTTLDAKSRGLSDEQALTIGAIAGAAEYYFESKGFESMFGGNNLSGGAMGYFVDNLKTELVGELGTELTNDFADFLVAQDMNKWKLSMEDYVERGYSESEALSHTIKDYALKYADVAAGTLFSSGVIAAPSAIGVHSQNKAVGKDLRGAEQIGDVLNIASMTPEESEAYEAYTRYANKGVTADNITDAQLGNLYNTMSSDVKGGFRTAVTDLANAHGEMTTQRTTLGYEYESAKKDMLSAKAEIDTLKGIIDSKESTEVQKASASADLDNAIAKYNEAQQRMNRAYEPAVASESLTDRQRNKAQNKLDKAVSEYTDAQTRFGKYAPIADKLSGVEESVGAYNAKRAAEKAEAEKRAKHEAEVKKLSSGVETSVMADTDKAIEIKGMKDSDTLITSDGEVKLKDVELSDRDADLVAYARGMEASEASLYLEQYKGEENIEEYTNTFSLVTSMAKNNYSEDAILKAKGSLSTEQFNAIYAATVTERYREKQRNIDKLNAEMAGKMSYKGVIDDSVINYGNKTVKGKVKWSDLNSRQREAITFISGFAKATGINLKLIADGEKRGINGSYDPSSNTITIDVYAGMSKSKNLLKDTIIPTMSHETTHWMKEKSPELYRKMGDLVFKTLEAHDGVSEVDRVASEVARQKAKGKNITDDGARDEIIARACEDMLKMSEEGKRLFNSLSESEKKTFIDKVKEILANLMEWVDNLLNSYSSDRYEAKVMREYKDTLAELSKMWDEMLVSSVQNNSSMELAGVFGHLTNGVSEDGTTIVGEKALQMSDRTYREGGRDFLVNWLDGQKGISEEDKQNIIEQTDRIAELMRAVAEDNELPDYSAWADMEVVKDENGEKLLSVIVKNGDYAMNIDFSQVCKKRVALNAVLNAMVQSGDLNVHTLTETDVAELNAIIKEHDFEIACALCFVDSKRYRVGAWAESFCDGSDEKVKGKGMVHKYGFNEMVRSLVPKGSKLKVDEFNFTGRDIAGQPTQNLVSEADDSELDFTLIDKIMSENDVKSAQHRYARAIKEHPEIRKILNKAEIISSIGLDAIRLEAPELYKIVNGHQGTAKPKFSHDVVAYGNDILKASNFTAEKAKMVGGVRCQSFSDFMANMVVDYAQFISELSAKGLTSHSYTKEPLFVKLFGLTGMKINMSLVPKAIDMTSEQQERFAILKDKNANKRSKAYKEALAEYNKLAENAGLDENGNYIWEDETFPYDIAMEIVVDPRYSANCGTIAVGISNKHILKLLADDRISMVIPYHKSGLNHEVAMMRDIALYNDYTKVQSTRFGYYKSLFGGNAGKKLDGVPDFDFYGDLYGVDGKEGTHDPKTTAQNYLNWCDRHNYIPKFDEFRGNPNYYKLLIDFRVYDVDGTYREQQPVKAIYPSNAEFKDLILNGVVDKNGKVYGGLLQQQQTSDKLSAETQQIVDEYRQRLTEKYGEDVLVQNDDRDADGQALTKEQIEFFKNSKVRDANGRLLKVYHGSASKFTVFLHKFLNSHGNAHGRGFYFTEKKSYAEGYNKEGGQLLEGYLNIENPLSEEKVTIKKSDLAKLIKATCEEQARSMVEDEGYKNIKEALPDTWVSNYVNTYSMNINDVYKEVADIIYSGSDNDVEIIAELTNAGAGNENVLRLTRSILGHDGVIYENEEGYHEFVSLTSNQFKNVDNTNPTMSDDIRYSDRDEDISVYEKLGELDRVLKERDILKEDIQRLYERLRLEGKVTNGKYFTDSSILNLAGFLLKKADSKYDKVELARRLKSLYHGMTTNTKVDSDALWSEVLEIANDIALMAKPKIVKNDYAMNLLKEIKGTRVRFNSNQKAEAKARFGANWNRSFFGKIILADNANMELDEQWQEWAEEHPDIFDANVNDGNQVAELYDIINALKEQSEVIEEYNKEEFVQYIATEILGATWNLKPIVTTADKYTAKIKEIRSEHKQAMKDVRDAYNARVDESRLAERMFYGKKMSEMRKEYDAKLEKQRKTDSAKMADKLAETREQHEAELYEKELAERMHFGAEIAKLRRQKAEKVAEAKELGKQKMAEYKENVAKKTKIQSITSNVLDLNDKLVKNSKDKHIPEAMKDAVGELLRAIDFSSKRKLEGGEPTKKDIALEKALGHLKDAITDGSKEIGDILDEMYGSGIDDSIKELVKSVDKHMSSIDGQVFTLNEMTLDELNKLDSIVKIIKATANKVNKFHVAQHNAGVQALGVRSMEEIDSRKKIFKDDKKHFEKMKTSVFWNNLNPFYAFKNLGEASQKIFTALQDGQDKLAFLSKEVIDFADSVYSAKDYNKWKDTYFEFEVAQPNGKIAKFSMNVPQIMSLYCVTKQEDARTHILHGGEDGEGGGITIVETDKKEAVRTNIRLTEADLNNIISKLDGVNNVKGDKTAKGVADELQEFMCRRGADLGNEISMARWGIKSFGITNYFPIKVSEGSVPMKNDAPGVDSVSMLELLNMSFTHARNHFAKQSVEIGDVFDVFSSHMSNMARYNAMALPILDMYKWMNSRVKDEYGAEHSVQTSIKDTFGEYAWKYFGTLLKDISGGTKKSTRDKLAVRFFKNAKVAKVAANIRVVALQFTSYIRAGAVMDNKYLLKALNYFSTRDLKDEAYKNAITKAKKYCGIALWKSMGYYDTDITRGLTEQIKHSTNVRSKLVELSLKGAEWADETTWGMMWNACEFEIRDKHPELKPKTEEYYKAVGERLRDVIYRTQVVDSMLTRSQMMRSPDAWDKVLTMFGSESTLSLNLAMDVFTSYELDKRSLGKEKAKAKNKKYIRKAITAYIVTNVVTSALQTLFDAFRDYDEDEKDEEYLTKLMLENFLSNSSIINKIPYLNAFSSIISGFTPSRTDVDWMNDSVKAVKAIYKCFAEGKSVEPAIKYTLKTLSDASGIAGYNLYRDIYALYELFNGD